MPSRLPPDRRVARAGLPEAVSNPGTSSELVGWQASFPRAERGVRLHLKSAVVFRRACKMGGGNSPFFSALD